jgi:hypothetical protein
MKAKASDIRHETWTARACLSQYATWIEWTTLQSDGDGEVRAWSSVQDYELNDADRNELAIIAKASVELNSRAAAIVERHLDRKAKRRQRR